jgi:hypothetical protein
MAAALFGRNETLVDAGNRFASTVTGFRKLAGDRIHLAPADAVASSTTVNGGAETLVTLSGNSTILLIHVSHVDGTFFV